MIQKLWNREYPEKLMFSGVEDLDHYLNNLKEKEHYLLVDDHSNEILGWSLTFERDKEKWFAIILHSRIQRQNYGTVLLQAIRKKTDRLSGWVIDHNNDRKQDGEYYWSPLNFYLKNGFILRPEIRLESDKISAVKIEWKKYS